MRLADPAPRQHADAVATLNAWRAPTSHQEALRRDYLNHLARHSDGTSREGPPAHLTASCFVLDAGAERVLLTLHRKGGFWVQLGGHLEPGDAGLAAAALREGREESGLRGLRLLPAGRPAPVDLHRHVLSDAFGRCREHLDVAFAAVAPEDERPSVSAESLEVAWWPVDALPAGVVPDLPARLGAVVDAVRRAV
ncbi:MAG TPA: NUDIX domain-containing protein [Actinomycetales bacterium]|nr:NUDIX domain-containing protein [Actinomycetales bacterium]